MAPRDYPGKAITAFAERYEDIEVIGRGCFGLIHKVRRVADGKILARKEIKYDRMGVRDRDLILEEIRILEQLKHENVVQFEEKKIDQENETIHIVMEYCGGGDLYSVIKKHRREKTRLSEDAIWAYIAQLVVALDACHYHGNFTIEGVAMQMDQDWRAVCTDERLPGAILHRDLKPENVFLDDHGRVKLGDFGLSKQTTASGFAMTYVGTPYYMSPEVVQGQRYDASSDIWALGCLIYELCTLRPAFDSKDTHELSEQICGGRIPSLVPYGYSEDLDELIGAMLNLDHRVRPTTRRLLTVPPIRWACKTLHLDHQLSVVAAEVADLQRRKNELLEHEATVNAAMVAQLNSTFTQGLQHEKQLMQARIRDLDEREQRIGQIEARIRDLDEREQRLKQMEDETLKKEKSVEAQRQMCSDEWEKWYNGEKGKALEEYKALASKVLELEAQLRQPQSQLSVDYGARDGQEHVAAQRPARRSDVHAGRKTALPRADSLTGNLSVVSAKHPVAAIRPITRPTTRRTASGGKARLSPDGDVSMASIRDKVVAGTTGLGTPRSIRQRDLEAQQKQQARNGGSGSRPRTKSQDSDEWIDQDGLQEECTPPPDGSRVPREHVETRQQVQASGIDPSRSSHRRHSLARSVRRQALALDPIGDAPNPVSEPVEASRPARTARSSMAKAGLSDSDRVAEAEAHAFKEEQRVLNAIAARSTASASAAATTSAPVSPDAIADPTLFQPLDASGLPPSVSSSSLRPASTPDDPQWLQYNEEDRPSPFIKRMVRLPERTISRLSNATGSMQTSEPNLRMKAIKAAGAAVAAGLENGGPESFPSIPSVSCIIDEDASMTSLSRIEAPIATRPAPPPPRSAPTRTNAQPPASAHPAPLISPRREAQPFSASPSASALTNKENVRANRAAAPVSRPPRHKPRISSSSSIPSLTTLPANGTTIDHPAPLTSDVVNQVPSTAGVQASGTSAAAKVPAETRRQARPSALVNTTAQHTAAEGTSANGRRRPRPSLLANITVAPLKPPPRPGITPSASAGGGSTTGLASHSALTARTGLGLRRERERTRERDKERMNPVSRVLS